MSRATSTTSDPAPPIRLPPSIGQHRRASASAMTHCISWGVALWRTVSRRTSAQAKQTSSRGRSRWPSPVHPGPGHETWTPSNCCEHWQRRSGCYELAVIASRRPRFAIPGLTLMPRSALGSSTPPGATGCPGAGCSATPRNGSSGGFGTPAGPCCCGSTTFPSASRSTSTASSSTCPATSASQTTPSGCCSGWSRPCSWTRWSRSASPPSTHPHRESPPGSASTPSPTTASAPRRSGLLSVTRNEHMPSLQMSTDAG
jgi:hypothetical protein